MKTLKQFSEGFQLSIIDIVDIMGSYKHKVIQWMGLKECNLQKVLIMRYTT